MSEKATSEHTTRVLTLAHAENGKTDALPDAAITRSWGRCVGDYGLDPVIRRDTRVLDRALLKDHQERVRDMLEVARGEMDHLCQQIAGSGSAVILTDREGVILHCVTTPGHSRSYQRAGLWLGADWSEVHEGTNGIGTCLIERRPVTIHRTEHFLSRHIGLSCSAAPIFDPQGQLLGVLDASSSNSRDSRKSQAHALALATNLAKMIENCVFQRRFRLDWVLRFHDRAEFVGQLTEGMLAFDGEGRILGVNHSALGQIGLTREELVGREVAGIFDVDLDTLMGRFSRYPNNVWPVRGRLGRSFFAMLRGPELPVSALRSTGVVERLVPAAPAPRPDLPGQAPRMDLTGLGGRDPVMAYNARCVEKVVNKKVCILLYGETGTGKEAFAKAIHAASDRAAKPFVAVNCAAIPENLIESELFGYKHGAFTGARREGMRGKILQAHGGTLFLDEIGDMPPPLQTRLLRVLEEREILALGAETPIPVDLNIVSATHRNLGELIAQGSFREDLYYRLNGIVLTLPALRERADLEEVIRRVLQAESDGQSVRLHEGTLALLTDYPWPGNIRQLRNILRTAVALCEGGVVLPEDLPPELRRHVPTPAVATVLPALSLPAPAPVPVAAERPDAPADAERGALLDAEKMALLCELDKHRWNMTKTAHHLGLSRNTLYRKLHKHGITPPTLG